MKAGFDKIIAFSALCCLFLTVDPVAAHHSTTMFDVEKPVQLSGTVKELHWANPHVSIVVNNANQAGPTGLWVIELTSPSKLVRSGWNKTMVKPGDRVTVDIAPLRDGTKGGALRKITLIETGQIYTYNIGDQERPYVEQAYVK